MREDDEEDRINSSLTLSGLTSSHLQHLCRGIRNHLKPNRYLVKVPQGSSRRGKAEAACQDAPSRTDQSAQPLPLIGTTIHTAPGCRWSPLKVNYSATLTSALQVCTVV